MGQGAGLGLPGAATRSTINFQLSTLNFFTLALRWSAGIAAVLAVVLTAIHLLTPQLAVTERTLVVARKFLVPPAEQGDFEYLAAKPMWTGQRLQVLRQHAHLANYNRGLVNWKVPEELYRAFVLSPEISSGEIPAPRPSPHLGGEREMGPGANRNNPLYPLSSTINFQPSTDLNWRRELWEFFYPRIRRESTPGAAAEIVLREVRKKIAVAEASRAETILEMWRQGRASATGRARLQVAALRAVGIPARLNQADRAEFWNGSAWVE